MHQNATANQNVNGSFARETQRFAGIFPASVEATATEKVANPSSK
jgi:hypothetical protein